MKIHEAESLLRLQQDTDGQAFLRSIAADFDEAMMALLFSPPSDIHAKQGRAQAYHQVLKKFTDAKAVLEAQHKGK
jgi:hypothetical protein